ncbi:MAG: transposase [Polyangiaceae bacterium]|nr:transposase [Polyangiaceae bacterium]
MSRRGVGVTPTRSIRWQPPRRATLARSRSRGAITTASISTWSGRTGLALGAPRRGPRGPNAAMYRRLHRAPWLLATSLPHTQGSERRIKQLYTLRMQIEETFRDLKCHRWGFGLRYANCRTAKRLELLLLVGTLAALVTWLVGLGARAMDWTRHLQANTVRKREVLSTFFIGRQLLARPASLLPPLLAALITLRRHLLPPVPV